jgi:hypothetical protein
LDEVSIIVLAVAGTPLRDDALQVGECFRIGAIGEEEDIVDILLRQAMNAGVSLQVLHGSVGCTDGASDQAPGSLLAELQQQVGGELAANSLLPNTAIW